MKLFYDILTAILILIVFLIIIGMFLAFPRQSEIEQGKDPLELSKRMSYIQIASFFVGFYIFIYTMSIIGLATKYLETSKDKAEVIASSLIFPGLVPFLFYLKDLRKLIQ